MILWMLACAPSVESAPDKAARGYCKQADACGLLQDGERTETCEPNAVDGFEAMWTEDLCPEGFDRQAWASCEEAITTWDCEDLTAGWVGITEACSSREICP